MLKLEIYLLFTIERKKTVKSWYFMCRIKPLIDYFTKDKKLIIKKNRMNRSSLLIVLAWICSSAIAVHKQLTWSPHIYFFYDKQAAGTQ